MKETTDHSQSFSIIEFSVFFSTLSKGNGLILEQPNCFPLFLDSNDYCGGCPWLRDGNSCYFYLEAELTFERATATCDLFGATLAGSSTNYWAFSNLKYNFAYKR